MSRSQRSHDHIISIWGDFDHCPYSTTAKDVGIKLQKEGHKVHLRNIPINLFRTLKSNRLTIKSTEDMLRGIPSSEVPTLTMPVIKVDGKWMRGGSEEFRNWETKLQRSKLRKSKVRSRSRSKRRIRRSRSKRRIRRSRLTKSRSRSFSAQRIQSLIRRS